MTLGIRRSGELRLKKTKPASKVHLNIYMLSQVYAFEHGSEYAAFVGDPDKELFVAVDDRQVVGFAGITRAVYNPTARIEGIFVHPHYRRWGIGTHLIRTCLHFAREKQRRAVFSEVSLTDLGWTVYLKAGFRVCGFSNEYYAPRSARPETALLLICELEEEK